MKIRLKIAEKKQFKTDRQRDRETDRQTDRLTDRQTDRHLAHPVNPSAELKTMLIGFTDIYV